MSTINTKSGIVLSVAVLLLSAAAQGDWFPSDGHKMHHPQRPDPRGWDVCLWGQQIADDFECSESGPITDLHFWISWKDDLVDIVPEWSISIHENIDYSDGISHPGRELWRFTQGKIVVREEEPSLQGWLCPCYRVNSDDPDLHAQSILPENHTWYAQVNITEIQKPFLQEAGRIYWLVIRANLPIYDSYDYTVVPPEVGWKTALQEDAFGSPALWRPWHVLDRNRTGVHAGTGGDISVTNHPWEPVISPDGTALRPHDMAFVITGHGGPVPEMDFGDAEETKCQEWGAKCNSYPTTLARDGARHYIDPAVYLGDPYTDTVHIDAEPDGQPSHLADGDDLTGADDEDGVIFTSPIVPGRKAQLEVLASTDGFLDAWIDFNADGDWDDLGERIFRAEPLALGANALEFEVPPTTSNVTGMYTYARFRFSTYGDLNYFGPAHNGEVEDYLVKIEPAPQPKFDFGDAPESYSTTLLSNGARHIINPSVRLGRYIDGERDGLPSDDAEGDDLAGLDDEDGVLINRPLIPGMPTKIKVIASTDGFLNAWVDFAADGNWGGSQDQVFADEPVSAGVNYMAIHVPASAASNVQTYARFRFTTYPLANSGSAHPGYAGLAEDGEVEDYMLKIVQPQPVYDFGDAPERPCNQPDVLCCPGYPTTLVRDGARHVIDPDVFLGAGVDHENDGKPTVGADGDDLAGHDDEDGVVFVTPLVPGFEARIEVTAACRGRLDAWIDFNADGDWDDFGEHVFAGEALHAGLNDLAFKVPPYPHAVPTNARTYARFRFSRDGYLSYGGPASDGEVEDYLVRIEHPERAADLGDAPDSTNSFGVSMTAYPSSGMLPVIVPARYPTVYKAGSPPYGPIHWQPRAVAHLGTDVSLEREADFGFDEDPVNNIIPLRDTADLDRADDCVRLPLVLPHCRETRFEYLVKVIRPVEQLYVNVWLDFNRDGDWDDVIPCKKPVPLPDNIQLHRPPLAREWAVRNQVLENLPVGLHSVKTPPFVSWHPYIPHNSDGLGQPIRMRITLAERPCKPIRNIDGVMQVPDEMGPDPAEVPVDYDWGGYGGAGPKNGYWIGETEDYIFAPRVASLEDADLNADRVVDLRDLAVLGLQWLSAEEP